MNLKKKKLKKLFFDTNVFGIQPISYINFDAKYRTKNYNYSALRIPPCILSFGLILLNILLDFGSLTFIEMRVLSNPFHSGRSTLLITWPSESSLNNIFAFDIDVTNDKTWRKIIIIILLMRNYSD